MTTPGGTETRSALVHLHQEKRRLHSSVDNFLPAQAELPPGHAHAETAEGATGNEQVNSPGEGHQKRPHLGGLIRDKLNTSNETEQASKVK